MNKSVKVLVQGAGSTTDLPGIDALGDKVELVFSPDGNSLERVLPGAEILLGWKLKGDVLAAAWHHATELKWIHSCFAGVDTLLFDDLINSDVVLTNARGIFDRAMAEYVLGYMLVEAKDFSTTIQNQGDHDWNYRLTRKIQGDTVLVFGVGSIGREIARVLSGLGLKVSGVGRSERRIDPDFNRVYAPLDINEEIAAAHWIISVMPATPSTEGYFDSTFFSKMNPGARFVNVGRGQAVVEQDLVTALKSGGIAGAMLDVLRNEPLDSADGLWDVPNLFISPHNSGDFYGFESDIVEQFVSNFETYVSGEMLAHIVDKELGFVPSTIDGNQVA